jgi:hypothetical protein
MKFHLFKEERVQKLGAEAPNFNYEAIKKLIPELKRPAYQSWFAMKGFLSQLSL